MEAGLPFPIARDLQPAHRQARGPEAAASAGPSASTPWWRRWWEPVVAAAVIALVEVGLTEVIRLSEIRQDRRLGEVRADFKEDLASLRAELKADNAALRAERKGP